MASLVPPQAPLRWTHSPQEVADLIKEALEKDKEVLDRVAALPPSGCNFETVFRTLANAEANYERVFEPLTFYSNVATSKELRDAASEAEDLARSYAADASMRLDVFQAKLSAERNLHECGAWEKLDKEEQRLVQKMIKNGKRQGLSLDEETRTKLLELQKDLEIAKDEFRKNYREENGHVTFTLEELEGVPADVISGYTKRIEGSTEVYDVSFKTPDISPVFGRAVKASTRKNAHYHHDRRLAINAPVLEKVLELRRQVAKLLGYPTWADYVTEDRMVGTSQATHEFLKDLEAKLCPLGEKDRENLLALKKADCENLGLPYDETFYQWDNAYYGRLFVKQTLDLDGEVIKQYFPVSAVVSATLEIYQQLLGVKFVELKGETWHPDVQMYAVWENNAKDQSDFHGYCYLDLYPREFKFPHNAVWPLISGYDLPSGGRQYPVATMVANLAKPTSERPALMIHFDVVQFFHEMGHVFHHLLSKTKFQRFHGTTGALDFVEAPSQMLENWCWEPKVLKKMSCHYETNEPLSDELINKLIKSRHTNTGLFYLQQLFYAEYDLKVHSDQEPTDYTQLWYDMAQSVSLVKRGSLAPAQGAFQHLIGYDVGYYGYTYSLVFSADMYATVFKRDPLDPELGKHYRETILLAGASRDELEILEDFLGRPPNSDAFLQLFFGASSHSSD